MVVRIENGISIGNGGDGVRVEGNHDVEINGLITACNGGDGLNVTSSQGSDAPERRWFEMPLGIVALAVFASVVGGWVLYYFGWI